MCTLRYVVLRTLKEGTAAAALNRSIVSPWFYRPLIACGIYQMNHVILYSTVYAACVKYYMYRIWCSADLGRLESRRGLRCNLKRVRYLLGSRRFGAQGCATVQCVKASSCVSDCPSKVVHMHSVGLLLDWLSWKGVTSIAAITKASECAG